MVDSQHSLKAPTETEGEAIQPTESHEPGMGDEPSDRLSHLSGSQDRGSQDSRRSQGDPMDDDEHDPDDDQYQSDDYGEEGGEYGPEEDPEEEDIPLIEPISYVVSGYGDETAPVEEEEQPPEETQGNEPEEGEEGEENYYPEDGQDGDEEGDEDELDPEGSEEDRGQEDDGDVEDAHSETKVDYANETFRGPMNVEQESNLTSEQAEEKEPESSKGGDDKSVEEYSGKKNLDSVHKIQPEEDYGDYQSPDKRLVNEPIGIVEGDTKMLSTASFKLGPQPTSSIQQIKNDYEGQRSEDKTPKGFKLTQSQNKIEISDQKETEGVQDDIILTLGNDQLFEADSKKQTQDMKKATKAILGTADSEQRQSEDKGRSGRETADLLRSQDSKDEKPSKSSEKDSMAQAGETFSDNLGRRVKGGLNVNMISYQTANFGAVNQSINTIKSAAFGGANQNETGASLAQQTIGEDEESRRGFAIPKSESRLSQPENEGHVLGMGITVGANLSSQVTQVPAETEPAKPIDLKEDKSEDGDESKKVDEPVKDEKLTTFSAAADSAILQILTTEQKLIMFEQSNNWQIRTKTIDEIHIQIQKAIEDQPEVILKQSEELLEFFVGLLGDQNFKIVLMTLSIVNLIIGMPQHLSTKPGDQAPEGQKSPVNKDKDSGVHLSGQCLSKNIPRFIGRLADSKNIIRQQAVRALIGIFQIMRHQNSTNGPQKPKENILQSPISPSALKHGGPKIQSTLNNFVPLVLPYLVNSNSWHVREELLHVLIICFLKTAMSGDTSAGNGGEFDAVQILEMLLKMLDDQKQRIRFTAVEAIVAFVNICNKQRAQQIIYQFGDRSMGDLIMERLKAPAQMNPHLNENGALEMPYLEHVEEANQFQIDQQQQMNSTNGRREGLNSGPPGQMTNLNQSSMNQTKRGNSSGRKFGAPPSANSLSGAGGQAKRTASANNPKQFVDQQAAGLQNNSQLYNQNAKKFQSPMYNAFEGFSQQQTTNALSDFGSAISTSNGNMYGSSKRQQISRHSNDRTVSITTSFLPQLNNQNSQMGPSNLDTPQPQSMFQQNMIGGTGGPNSSNLQGMVMRGPPSSENRFYQNFNELGNSFYNQNGQYQRKFSANSHNQIPMPLKSRGSGAPSPSQMMMQGNNLSNHPINLLKDGMQAPIASNQTDPMVSPQQPSFNQLMSRKYKNVLSMEYDSLSEMGGSVPPGQVGGGGGGPRGHMLPSGYMKQGSMQQHQQLILQQPFSTENEPGKRPDKSRNGMRSRGDSNLISGATDQDQTQSSYYSHSRGGLQSYSQVSSNNEMGGRNSEVNHPSSQKHSAGGMGIGNPDMFMQQQYQQQLFSGGGMGEGPLQNIPPSAQGQMMAMGRPQPGFQNRMIGSMPPQQQQQSQAKYGKSGNTFYSDNTQTTGTTATSSTQVQNQLKQKQLRQQQLARSKLAMGGGTPQNQDESNITDSMGIFGISGRGPIKAKQIGALKQEDSQSSLRQGEGQGQTQAQGKESVQGLMIDSRRPKRPIGSTSYDIDGQDIESVDQGGSPTHKVVIKTSKNLEKARRSNLTMLSNAEKSNDDLLADGDGFATASFKLAQENGAKNNERSRTAVTGGSSVLHNKITYIASEDLEPLDKLPDKTFQQALLDLVSSPDWNIQFESCNTVRRVCKHHQNLVLQSGATLHSLVKQVCKLADSLRSSLSKIALITIRDMFDNLKRCMETYMDPIIKILLKRASDTTVFISDEANAALMSMTLNCSDRKVLTMLLVQNSKSTQQRVVICNCLHQLVGVLGNNVLYFKDSDKLISQLATYMKDASQEVRTSAKKAFMLMSHSVMGQHDFDRLLQRVLNEMDYKKVKSFLDSNAEVLSPTQSDYPQDFVIRNVSQQNHTSNGLGLQKESRSELVTAPQQLMQATPMSNGAPGAGATVVVKQFRGQGNKGTLRTGSLLSNKLRDSQNSSALQQSASGSLSAMAAAQQPSGNDLNIKATQLVVNPSKIMRGANRANLKTSGSQSSTKNGVLPSRESTTSLRHQ